MPNTSRKSKPQINPLHEGAITIHNKRAVRPSKDMQYATCNMQPNGKDNHPQICGIANHSEG